MQLQGWGEGSTKINALKQPSDKLVLWRSKTEQLVTGGNVNLLPGQETTFGGIEPVALFNEEGAGVLVLASAGGSSSFGLNRNQNARIDGFTIPGADTGGGISLQDAVKVRILHNTIANNDSLGTAGDAFLSPTQSTPQPGPRLRLHVLPPGPCAFLTLRRSIHRECAFVREDRGFQSVPFAYARSPATSRETASTRIATELTGPKESHARSATAMARPVPMAWTMTAMA